MAENVHIKAQQGAQKFAERMKDIAKETTGSDPGFARLVDRLAINDYLPIELAKHLQLCAGVVFGDGWF